MPKGIYKRKNKGCLVDGCNNKHMAKRYCNKHYSNFYNSGNPLGKFNGDKKAQYKELGRMAGRANRKAFICKIKNCNKKHYAKGYCKAHHINFLRTGNPLGSNHKCKIKGCNKIIFKDNQYCRDHNFRIKRNLSTDLRKDLRLPRMKGKNNPNWNGGISQYHNHSKMKRQRIIKLQQTKGLCEICGKKGYQIHHKDESKKNHNLNNFILLCVKCHGLIHTGRQNKTSKFIRLFGMTLDQMAEKFGGSPYRYHKMYRKNKLKEFLNSQKSK